MKKCINVVALAAFSIFMIGCNSSQSEIDKTSAMIQKAEKKEKALSDAEYDKLTSAMEHLQKHLDEHRDSYSDAQIREIGKLQGRYAAIAVKKGFDDFGKSVKDFGNKVEGFIEGITDTINNKTNKNEE